MIPGLAILGLCAGLSQAQPALEQAQQEARELVEERLERYKSLERLRKDLRYIAEELDREVLDEEDNKELSVYSRKGNERLRGLRQRGDIDPKLAPVLARLKELYKGLSGKDYARLYSASLVKAVNDELRWAAETGQNDEEILALLDKHLLISDQAPSGGSFPIDVPLADFKRWDPIRMFMVKHRITKPPSFAKTTVADIMADKHHVQVGVEIEGTVTFVDDCWFDMDYCFNMGELHVEISPEWSVLHPDTIKPKNGQRARLRGWTYYDYFHKSEAGYDPKHPRLGLNRPTLWEIHPLQEVEILK